MPASTIKCVVFGRSRGWFPSGLWSLFVPHFCYTNDITKTTELRNIFKFSYHCPAHFFQPMSSNSFPAYICFDQREHLKFLQQSLAHKEDFTICGKKLQINLWRKIIDHFMEEGGDFVTGNVSSWFESDLNMLQKKNLMT